MTTPISASIPLWCLLAFAAWTLIVLGFTIGVHRWSHILTGRANFATYGEYKIEGTGFYERGMRAHANCVENLPIFGAIVLVIVATGMHGRALDILALVVICVRAPHTFVHVAFDQGNNVVVGFRSILYIIQYMAMCAMVVVIVVGLLT